MAFEVLPELNTSMVVDADHFNKAYNNIIKLVGAANDVATGNFAVNEADAYGWGQTLPVTSLATGHNNGPDPSVADLISAAGGVAGAFAALQDTVQTMYTFLNLGTMPGSTADADKNPAIDVDNTKIIRADMWNNLYTAIETCQTNRFNALTLANSADSSTVTPAGWSGTVTKTHTWSFLTEADCREFFNGGGYLGVDVSYGGTDPNDASQDDSLWDLINTTVSPGSSPAVMMNYNTNNKNALGFYDLTTSFQNIVNQYSTLNPYTGDRVLIRARVNSTASPTQVIFEVSVTEGNDGGAPYEAIASRALTVTAYRASPNPNGSGFTFPTPTISIA